MACGILVIWPGIEPGPPAMEAQSPNYSTTREFPGWGHLNKRNLFLQVLGAGNPKDKVLRDLVSDKSLFLSCWQLCPPCGLTWPFLCVCTWRGRFLPGKSHRTWRATVCVCVLVAQSCLTLCNPIDCSPPGSSVLGILQARKENWSGLLFPSPGDLPNPGIEPGSPMLQEDSLPSEPPGKPKNTGVGSLSLLQGIFPTQELNWGLLHCRWILYQLSHEGSPGILEWVAYHFSRASSQPRNQTGVSCIAGRFFTNWAIREALLP